MAKVRSKQIHCLFFLDVFFIRVRLPPINVFPVIDIWVQLGTHVYRESLQPMGFSGCLILTSFQYIPKVYPMSSRVPFGMMMGPEVAGLVSKKMNTACFQVLLQVSSDRHNSYPSIFFSGWSTLPNTNIDPDVLAPWKSVSSTNQWFSESMGSSSRAYGDHVSLTSKTTRIHMRRVNLRRDLRLAFFRVRGLSSELSVSTGDLLIGTYWN